VHLKGDKVLLNLVLWLPSRSNSALVTDACASARLLQRGTTRTLAGA
jgi:hypothetical protein